MRKVQSAPKLTTHFQQHQITDLSKVKVFYNLKLTIT